MGGYDYAGNNPVTGSDPTGLCNPDRCGYGISNNGHIAQTGPVDPGNPDAGYYQDGKFQPPAKPNRKPAPVVHQPQKSRSDFGGKAGGEFAPSGNLGPSVGPPARSGGSTSYDYFFDLGPARRLNSSHPMLAGTALVYSRYLAALVISR
jgi:hypothetical protein